ncbi:MAG TPA: DUF6653 family protein [Candidatus Obscuribacterales bacterium]|jgi:hypothetical protein|uniref:DUF6653 family protein n=1 Tax=Leptolyngbya sp. CCY15150 TaxID=2767772 RepID=UPI001951D573|nr:DUF6653 family protein [Leptolyngbya sp. CCY15150]
MVARTISTLFAMDERTWRGHANPWCFWTRLSTIPLLFLAIWSRVWLGWDALWLAAVALGWIWVNARLFPPPKSTRNWMSKGVFGERVWINRSQVPIPPHHHVLPQILTAVAALGMGLGFWGLWQLDLPLTLVGTLLIFVGKLWFFDRMVWLYEDMKDATPEYQSWLY